jgi:hypothetical protein
VDAVCSVQWSSQHSAVSSQHSAPGSKQLAAPENCHSERSEESAVLPAAAEKQIPAFGRNDKMLEITRAAESLRGSALSVECCAECRLRGRAPFPVAVHYEIAFEC